MRVEGSSVIPQNGASDESVVTVREMGRVYDQQFALYDPQNRPAAVRLWAECPRTVRELLVLVLARNH